MERMFEVHRESSPGYPYSLEYATNAMWLDEDPVKIFTLVRQRLKLLMSAEDAWSDYIVQDPLWAVENGLTDPVMPFHKKEPHTKLKIAEKRFRIICAVSIVDQIVERVLGGDWAEHVKNAFPSGPIACGIGFTDEQIQLFGEEIEATAPLRLYTDDVSGFDSMQRRELLLADNTVRERRCVNLHKLNGWRAATRIWASLKTGCTYAMPSGKLLTKTNNKRVLPSGTYETTMKQSSSKGMLAEMAGSTFHKENGDDGLEANALGRAAFLARYAALGFPLKSADECTNTDFEFCSHRFHKRGDRWIAPLLTWPKALFGLLTEANLTLEQISAVKYEMRHNAELREPRFADIFAQMTSDVVAAAAGDKIVK
jgi:hypothetical protein